MFPVVNAKPMSSAGTLHHDGRVFRLPDEDSESDHRRTSSYPQFFQNDLNDDDSDGDIRTVKTNTSLTLNSIEETGSTSNNHYNTTAAVFPLSPASSSTKHTAALFPNSPFNITTAHIIRDDSDDFAADDERETSYRSESKEQAYRSRSVRPKKDGNNKVVTTSFPTISDWNHVTVDTTGTTRPKMVTPTMRAESTSTGTSAPTVSTASQSTGATTPDRSNVYHYLIDERIAMSTKGETIRTIAPTKLTTGTGMNAESPYSDRIEVDNSSIFSSTGSNSPSPNQKGYVDMSPLNATVVEPMLLNMSGRHDDNDDVDNADDCYDNYSSSHNNGSPFVDESSYSFSLGGGNVSVESPPRNAPDNVIFPVTTGTQNSDPNGMDVDSNWIKTSWSYLQMMAKTASSSYKGGGGTNDTTIVDLDDTVASSQPSTTNNTYNNNNNDILSLNGNDDQLTYDSTLFRKKNEHGGGLVLAGNNYCTQDETSTLPSTGSTYDYCMNSNNMQQQNLSEPVKLVHEGTQSTFIIAYGSSEDDSTKDIGIGNNKNMKHDTETFEILNLAPENDGQGGASISDQESMKLTTTRQRRRRCIWILGVLLVLIVLAFAVSEVVCIFSSCSHLGLFSPSKTQSSNEDKSVDSPPPPNEDETPVASPVPIFDGNTSVVPTSAPSLRVATSTNEPTIPSFTTQPTMGVDSSTVTPTFAPMLNTNITLKFNTTEELYNAVDLYLIMYANASMLSTLPPIEQWDVSQLYNMSRVFSASRNPLARYFNADLSMWNTSSVAYMGSLFQQAENFNGDITTWDVSRVIDMYEAFASAYKFNQDISLWNVANVQEMSRMFMNCAQFNQNIGFWNTSSASSMHEMFKNAPSFNQNLYWNTARVSDMSQMFEDADAFDGDVSTFKIGNVVNMQMMFRNAISFTGRPDLSLWNFSNVEEASEMFYGAVSFQGIGISWWNIDSLLSPNLMFAGAKAFSQDLCSNWHTSLLTLDGTKNMFAGTSCPHEEVADPVYPDRSNLFCVSCYSTMSPTISSTAPPSVNMTTRKAFTTNDELRRAVDEYMLDDTPSSYVAFQYGYPIGAWDVSLLSDFSQIFDSNRNTNLLRFNADLSGWNVSNAVSMYAMFQQTVSFTDLTNGLAFWDVSKVTDMSGMFASSRFSGDVSAWQVGRVTDFSSFADFASSFTSDLSLWNVSSAQDMSWMFRAAKLFNSNIANWDISSVTDFSSMFSGASSFNQNLCSWGPLIQAKSVTVVENVTSATLETRNMFAATACPYLLEPNMTTIATGPWCAACGV